MSAPHRDLPPGSQKWAEQVDALMDRVQQLEALVRRLARDARVDPSDPSKNINPAGEPPSAQSPVQTRITQHSDVKAYNVADKQVLTWSNAEQAFVPITPAGSGDFAPDPSVTQYTWQPSGYTMAHGTGSAATSDTSTGSFAWYGWTDDGLLDMESRSANYRMGLFTVNADGIITLYATSPATPTVRTRLEVNSTSDAVDVRAGAFGLPQSTTAGLPASSVSGVCRMVYNTDTGQLMVKPYGSVWTPVGGGGSDEFTPPSSAPFSFSGSDPQAEGHNTGSDGQYGFMATSDREVYLAANDAAYGDTNVYMSGSGINIQSDAPSTSSDWNMYSEAVVAKDGILLTSIQGNGTGAGGTVNVRCKWFGIPVNGTLYSASGHPGAMTLDPVSNKPLWSDGTNWRDATGTIV